MNSHVRLCPDELGTVLTIWAHPDDEAYLAGGLLAALTDAGQRAVCVTATRGEAASPEATPEERAALAGIRTVELEKALEVLGVTEHHWLDHPDGGCASVAPDRAARQLTAVLDDVRPDTVITFGPDGFTGHPDHRAVSTWTDLALRSAADGGSARLLHAVAQPELMDREIDEMFGVYELGDPRFVSDEEVALRLTVEGAALERKVAALAAQSSQTAGLIEVLGHDRYAAWVATECFAVPAITG
jgi:LmbE family N-acetylglucosaminyl deacetylase